MSPSIGRIVLYRRAEQLVPAIISEVFNEFINDTRVNLYVFTNDAVGAIPVLHVSFGDNAGQWRWPVRVS